MTLSHPDDLWMLQYVIWYFTNTHAHPGEVKTIMKNNGTWLLGIRYETVTWPTYNKIKWQLR